MAQFLPKEPTVLRAKVLIVGEEKAGKTSLVNRFHGKSFQSGYTMTCGASLLMSPVKIPDTNYVVELHIFDLGGHAIFSEQRKLLVNGVSAIVGVYDASITSSLNNVAQYIDDTLQQARVEAKDLVGVLVGTKSDLVEQSEDAVSSEAANLTAGTYQFKAVSASALEGKGCDEPFMHIAQETIRKFEEAQAKYVELAKQ